jgi:hypothetical protein
VRREIADENLHSPRSTPQEVLLCGLPELDAGSGRRVGAENHHVAEIPLLGFEGVLRRCGRLAVDATVGEDGMDCCEDNSRRGEEHVAGVILSLSVPFILERRRK